ncbi:MAG: BlaI/MecI/CopY family transcriptional regulator [Pirellulales bacterium]|nr:BlaI/MecI/CopY family transcriptional regulator [Pirellulales bacterium]
MARPQSPHPTPAELELLKLLWEHGPATGRELHERLTASGRERAYTSVMTLLNILVDKGAVTRERQGKSHRYAAKSAQQNVRRRVLRDVWDRLFEGSAEELVTHLLEATSPDAKEIESIREAIENYRRKQKGSK